MGIAGVLGAVFLVLGVAGLLTYGMFLGLSRLLCLLVTIFKKGPPRGSVVNGQEL